MSPHPSCSQHFPSDHIDPSVPHADKINAILDRFREEIVCPYEQPGNGIARDMYDRLGMPWDGPSPITSFPRSLYIKHEFDRDGIPSNGKDFFGGSQAITFAQVEKILSTGSPVVRWREAHPDLVGTKDDLVAKLVDEVREFVGEQESLEVVGGTAILLFKKEMR